ncbi:DUF2163 domain-containing protein [Parasphingopyxis lamellibrachiae]|uniref:Putative phage protein (TIGR02218 family) n=1 Tax=Parasphingopyxis lamellibrachiae TaxID=680125 RepID=A0A3D9FEN2_9SPHN|nr:DUF2163 domain-containing protein [Parasphingopyxis lamellibrachiae]RED16037.1 putative phage protein (TIGR02218 family) [Parasphingopyxis lamellibrachiae]
MAAFLDAPITTIAFCWRLARRDGVALGFTTHDRDLVIGGLTYQATPGMLPSAVRLGDGLDASSMDVSGALTSDAITERDLLAGRWDGAAVSLFTVDWEAPDGETVPLARGELGAVSIEGDGFTAELKGPAAVFERPVSELTSPECRAQFGDTRCRVDLAPHIRITLITARVDEVTVDVASAAATPNAYGYGRLRWMSGDNSGLTSAILRSAGNRLTLRETPPFAIVPGAMVEITAGCDRIFATCRDRFSNAGNFRGEPHLPGNDLLTRYPGAS